MKTLTTWILVGLFLLGGIVVVADYTPKNPETTSLRFGMNAASIGDQADAGVKPDYGTFWVGPWTLKSGWGGPGNTMSVMREQGITPAIHFYYWGDDISPSCVEDGCWSDLHTTHKNRQGWDRLADELVENLHKSMKGEPVLILMETEFNKNGISKYEPFDHYLAQMAQAIREGYPAAEIVLAFGNWHRADWGNFQASAEASDYIGIQGMRGSTRDSLSSYRSIYEDTVHGVERLKQEFGKPIIIMDIALSSYPEPDYLDHQAETLEDFFIGIDRLMDAGVETIIYRTWVDNPRMDTNNYYGVAERHWGLTWPGSSELKPAGTVWVAGVQAMRSGQAYESPLGDERRFEADFHLSGSINQWWVETYASGSNPLDQVQARVDGGKWHTLEYTDWGTWAKSFNAPKGSEMVLRATDIQGNQASTFPFAYMQEAPRFDDSAYRPATASFSMGHDALTIVVDASASSDPYDRELTYHWEFGDGASANGPQTQHTYARSGNYHVTLSVHNGDLDNSTTETLSVQAPPPSAAFTVQTDGGLHAVFDASGSSDPLDRGLNYTWDLGDGTTTKGAHIDHTYPTGGTYTIALTVTNDESSNTTKQQLHLIAPPPEARFTNSSHGLTISLDASASSDPYDRPLNHTWDMGDGSTAIGAQVEHTYTASGSYNVSLSVDNGEQTNKTNRSIHVESPPPSASFNATTDGLHVTYDASGSNDPLGRDLSYTWDMGDGSTAIGAQVEHTYTASGTYNVSLSVDNGERVNTTTRTIHVESLHPRAAFETHVDHLQVLLDASDSYDPSGRDLSFTWDLGDGTTLNGLQAEHSYESAGDYTVLLTVDNGEHTNTTSRIVTAEQPPDPLQASYRLGTNVNEWWIEVYVDANHPLQRVQARVDGGSWRTLTPNDWGSWAASFHAPQGSEVVFRATDTHGQRMLSQPHQWLQGESDEEDRALEATFRVASGVNNWWVEVYVNANEPIERVQARVDGGSWRTLTPTDWGSWAASFHVASGSEVVFRATDENGQRVRSDPITWG